MGNSIRRGAVGGNGHCVQRSSPLAVRSAHAPRLATLLLVLVTFVACAAATPAPSIEAVRWHASGDQVAVEWRVTPASTGQVEFGPTTAYGRSSELETSYLSAHVQQLTGLEPGMEYHFRVVSAAPDGTIARSQDHAFTMAGLPQPQAATGIYGSGIAGDDKNNYPIDGRRLSHRFRAGTSSELLSVRFQQRGGPIYSAGTGGTLRVTVQADDGTPQHRPSGKVLSSTTVEPGNPSGQWTTYDAVDFPEPAQLVEGEIYHIVFHNTDAEPEHNYISVNELFSWREHDPRQPALDDDYAVLFDWGDGWQLSSHDTATMDLVYRDGTHDGQAYIENMYLKYGIVSGPLKMVRERFTVSGGDRRVSEVLVRVGRTFGDAPLTLQLTDDSGAVVAHGDIAAERIPLTVPGTSDSGTVWVSTTLDAPVTLRDGTRYDLLLVTSEGTQYTADPIREGTDAGLRSYRFTDGSGQHTLDGGESWADLYPWSPVDLQFYFR